MTVLHPTRNMVKSLPQESRDKLARCLNEASFDEIAGLKGIGPTKMSFLLGRGQGRQSFGYGLSLEELRGRTQSKDPAWSFYAWPIFTANPKNVTYCPYDSKSQFCITTLVFNTKAALKALLGHFEIPLLYDVNEHIVELRDLRTRLHFLQEMRDPVIQDYLRQIARELTAPLGTRP